MVRRPGFTLLELIVTIVLLGIIFSAVPMILIQNQNASRETLSQEAVYASLAKISQIQSFHWDEKSIPTNTPSGSVYTKIVDTLGDSELGRNGSSRYRIGHYPGSSRRSFFPSETNATAANLLGTAELTNGVAEVAPDDVDDLIQNGQVLIAADNQDGYKRTYTVDTTVNYLADDSNYSQNSLNGFVFGRTSAPLGATSSIKRISIAVSLDAVLQFQLDSYVSNIGEADIVSRIFP